MALKDQASSVLEENRFPMLTLDIPGEITLLKGDERWNNQGYNVKTFYEHDQLRIILAVMREGETIGSHQARCPLSFQVFQGSVQFSTESADPIILHRGEIVVLEAGVRHSIEALKDCALLITIPAMQRHSAEH